MNYGKLFVGNLNYTVTRTELEDLFRQFGEVTNVRFKSKTGHAFIDMASPEAAEKAMAKLNGTKYKGRVLSITPEVSKKQAKTQAAQNKMKRKKKKSKTKSDSAPREGSVASSGDRGRGESRDDRPQRTGGRGGRRS